MDENKTFWIKYLDCEPVEINTLYFNNQMRLPPLTNVGHLIAAYKVRTLPRFQNVPVDELTLYRYGNTLEALKPGKLLVELPATSDDFPLIIKSKNDGATPALDGYASQSFHEALGIPAEKIHKPVFSAQDSMNAIDTNGILKFDILGIDNKPDLLYSKEIYEAESRLGMMVIPVDTLLKTKFTTMVLIGVSGCGKTRTCFDYCRKKFGLYFDCTKDTDFANLCSELERSQLTRGEVTEETQQKFEFLSKRLILLLVTARLFVFRECIREGNLN